MIGTTVFYKTIYTVYDVHSIKYPKEFVSTSEPIEKKKDLMINLLVYYTSLRKTEWKIY